MLIRGVHPRTTVSTEQHGEKGWRDRVSVPVKPAALRPSEKQRTHSKIALVLSAQRLPKLSDVCLWTDSAAVRLVNCIATVTQTYRAEVRPVLLLFACVGAENNLNR